MKRKTYALSLVLFLLLPGIAEAYKAGDTVTCQAVTTPSSVVDNIEAELISNEFEGTNTTDTRIGQSDSILLGFIDSSREITVASAGDINHIIEGQDGLFVYEQELKVNASDVSELLSEYRSTGLSPVEKEEFDNIWNSVISGYQKNIEDLDGQHIDLTVASDGLRKTLIKEILDDIPPISSQGDPVKVSTNTDPFLSEMSHAFIDELSAISKRNQEIAKETADEILALTNSAPGSFTQIVSRPDMYGNYTYQGNTLTVRLWNQGTSDGKTSIELEIPLTPGNIDQVQAMLTSKDVNNSHGWPVYYKDMFKTLHQIMPDYDFSEAEAAFEGAELANGTYNSSYISVETSCPDTIGLVNQSANAYSIVPADSFFFYCLGLEPPVYGYVDHTIVFYGNEPIQFNEYGEVVGDNGSTLLPRTTTTTKYEKIGGSDVTPEEAAVMFTEKYMVGKYEVLTQAELEKLYPQDALTPNTDVYNVPGIYTGIIGSAARWFSGDLEVKNVITGSKEKICHASANNYDYVCFCAGTNGWVRIGTGSNSRFVRYTDLCEAENQAMEEQTGIKNVVKDCYMSCSGERNDQGHELITVIDAQAIAKQRFIKLSINDLRRIMGEHEITIGDLIGMYENPGFQQEIEDDPESWTRETQEWWDEMLEQIKQNVADGKDPFDGFPGSEDTASTSEGTSTGTDPEIGDPSDLNHPSDTFDFDLNDFIQWCIDQGFITADEIPGTPEEITQVITEYLPDYLNTYNGTVLMDVTRIITKQLKNTTTRETSKVVNKGYGSATHHWTVSVNGNPKINTRMSDTIQYTLAKGSNQINAFENLQNIYEDILTYDYTEEWVLEATGQVIYKKQIRGSLNGVDGAARDQNTIHFNKRIGPLHEVNAGSWTFVTDETEEDLNNSGLSDGSSAPVGIGSLFIHTSGGGYWINGMPSSIWSLEFGSVNSVDETYSFRIK